MKPRTLLLVLGGLTILLVLFIASLMFRTVPQPLIEIKGETLWKLGPLPIRNTLLTSWCIVAFVVALAYVSGRKVQEIPSGWQNFVEAIVDGIRGLVVNTAGEKNGARFFWVIATFLIYIAISNWFALLPVFNVIGKVEAVTPHHFHEKVVVVDKAAGLNVINFKAKNIELEVDDSACSDLLGEEKATCREEAHAEAIEAAREKYHLSDDQELAILAPYFRSVNTDLMTPLSFAIVSAIFVEWWGISTLGFMAYGRKFFNFGRLFTGGFMGAIDFFVGLLEFIAELARLISFSFRLFGNMLAGEILLLVMTFLLPFTFVVVDIFYGLELFVGAIQAFVFGMLTLVFAVLAVSSHGGHEEEHAEGEAH